MNTTNLKTQRAEIIPAVLVKTKEALLDCVNKVSPYARTIHIDVMDNKFVPNLTIGLEELSHLPKNLKYEFHWMVRKPEKWIKEVKGAHLHLVHIETVNWNWEEIKKAVEKAGGKLGLAINPETSLAKIIPYIKDAERILIMSVHPGFSGQKYIKETEEKISLLRKKFPKLAIEVDGGINGETAASAVKAGGNRIVAASAIFGSGNISKAIGKLKRSISGAHES